MILDEVPITMNNCVWGMICFVAISACQIHVKKIEEEFSFLQPGDKIHFESLMATSQ